MGLICFVSSMLKRLVQAFFKKLQEGQNHTGSSSSFFWPLFLQWDFERFPRTPSSYKFSWHDTSLRHWNPYAFGSSFLSKLKFIWESELCVYTTTVSLQVFPVYRVTLNTPTCRLKAPRVYIGTMHCKWFTNGGVPKCALTRYTITSPTEILKHRVPMIHGLRTP